MALGLVWVTSMVVCAAASAPPAPPPVSAPVAKIQADPKAFEAALNKYFSNDQRHAAPKLFSYVQSSSTTDENFAWAEFFLGKSLADLGLHHAAAVYLTRIARERSNPQVVPRALEELRKFVDIPHDEKMIDEEVFGSLDLGFLPEEVDNFVNLQQGLVDIKVGNERWAGNHFAKLAANSPEAWRAKYAVLVTRLKTGKDPSTGMIDEFLELSKQESLSQEIRNDATLAVARLRYEKADYAGALEAYAQVKLPMLNPGRATLYLEEAWTRYRLGQVHAAMGLLTTLDAPVFRNEFLPDKYLLRALIYRDLCHYLPAKRAAKELTRRYADSLDAIHNRDDLSADRRLRRAADATGETKQAFKFLESLRRESELLGKFSGVFESALFNHLTKIYDLAIAEATRIYQARLDQAVRDQADKLLRAAEQVRLMDYEVGLKMYERVKRGVKVVNLEEEALSPSQIGFRFDGEYWNDELRNYRFSLKNRCAEENQP